MSTRAILQNSLSQTEEQLSQYIHFPSNKFQVSQHHVSRYGNDNHSLVVSTHLKNRSHWGSWSQNIAKHKNNRNLIKAASWMSSLKPNYCSVSFRVPAWQCLEVPEAEADDIDNNICRIKTGSSKPYGFLMIFDELLILCIYIYNNTIIMHLLSTTAKFIQETGRKPIQKSHSAAAASLANS